MKKKVILYSLLLFFPSLYLSPLLAGESTTPSMMLAALDTQEGPPPCGSDGICNRNACSVDPDCPADMPPRTSPGSPTDKAYITGAFGGKNPALLISGRFKDSDGDPRCRYWVSYNSASSMIEGLGNWIDNAVFDGCDSEVAVFSENGTAYLKKPEGRWTKNSDSLSYEIDDGLIQIPTSVWVIYADTDFADEKVELVNEFQLANDILKNSKCGIKINPVHYYNKTSAISNPEQPLGCGMIESIFKQMVGFHEDKMNVYIVKTLQAEDRAGVACRAESDNVIVLDQGRFNTALVHEYGHWFDLWHTTQASMPLVNVKNIMSDVNKTGRDMMTAGQCYRANFSKDSYINMHKLRKGPTKNCKHLQDADGHCPGLKNEF